MIRRYLTFSLTSAVALVIMGLAFVYAQKPDRVSGPRPFEPAEELIYQVEFSKSLFRKVDIADFRFTSNRTPLSHTGAKSNAEDAASTALYELIFTGDVSSKGFFSKLFRLHFHQYMESKVEPISFTVQKTNRLDEQGKRVRKSEAVFDLTTGKVVWAEHDPNDPNRQPRTASSEFSGQVQDVLSVIYYLRTKPLEVGNSFEVPISDSGKVYRIPMQVTEKRRMKTLLGRVDVVRVDPELFGPNRMIHTGGQLSIWLTDDPQHIPVRARVKNEYGTFDIKLKKIKRSPGQPQSLMNHE
jgi:uncharacterized protein DUF3108